VNSWKVILATIVIFGAGVFSGGLLVNYVDHSRPGNHRPPSPPRAPEELVARPEILKTNFVQRLDDALHLSPDQRKAIEKIVADGQERNSNLWKIVSPQMRDVIQDTRQHIREALTPEQKKQFEELTKRPHRPQNSTNAPSAYKTNNLTPEEQVIITESQRLQTTNNSPQVNVLPPAPLMPTNAPAN
jgi:hypothetical protein